MKSDATMPLFQQPAANVEITVRDYQGDSIDELTTEAGHYGHRKLLLVAPTGSGKTVVASKIISHAAGNGMSVLFLAHRRELVKQCVDKLIRFGVTAGTIMAGEFLDQSHKIQVASIQSLHSWSIRKKTAGLPPADLVVIDEAHHLTSSKTWKEVLAAYGKSLILGMTATPINRRGKGLGHFFDSMVQMPSIGKLTEMGYLVPATYKVPSLIDLKGVKILAGEYNEKQLEAKTDVPKVIGDIVENWARFASDRQTLAFFPGIKSSIHTCEQFQKIGIKAAHIDGFTPAEERDEILGKYGRGELQIICNVGVFTEGTDLPTTSCIIMARATKSLVLYIQIIGRGLRTSEGKKDCMILDHTGARYEFGPIDQEWAWKLEYGDGDCRAETRKGHVHKRDITCVECKEVYWGRLDCPKCGSKPKLQGKEFATYPAFLEAMEEIENPKPVDPKTFYQMLLGYCQASGKKPGLAYYKYMDRYGDKPLWAWKNLPPIEPNAEVKAWLLKQQRTFFWKQRNPDLAASMDKARQQSGATTEFREGA